MHTVVPDLLVHPDFGHAVEAVDVGRDEPYLARTRIVAAFEDGFPALILLPDMFRQVFKPLHHLRLRGVFRGIIEGGDDAFHGLRPYPGTMRRTFPGEIHEGIVDAGTGRVYIFPIRCVCILRNATLAGKCAGVPHGFRVFGMEGLRPFPERRFVFVKIISKRASSNDPIEVSPRIKFETYDNSFPCCRLYSDQIIFSIAVSLIDSIDIFQHMVDECFGISKACCPNFFSVSLLNMLDSLFIQHNLTGLVQPER